MKEKLFIPIAIIVAGLLIAGGFYFGKPSTGTPNTTDTNGDPELAIRPVSTDDHVFGTADAKVVIVEYSDTSCPFCKLFHETMNNVMGTYSRDEVSWVYRNFPIPQLHPFAINEAQAIECAAELGGNDAFWKYTNRLYEIQTSTANPPKSLDQKELPNIAEFAGLNRVAFETCLAEQKYTDKINADIADAQGAGARGTPFNILVLKEEAPEATRQIISDLAKTNADVFGISADGKKIKIAGALYGQYEQLFRDILDSILEN